MGVHHYRVNYLELSQSSLSLQETIEVVMNYRFSVGIGLNHGFLRRQIYVICSKDVLGQYLRYINIARYISFFPIISWFPFGKC